MTDNAPKNNLIIRIIILTLVFVLLNCSLTAADTDVRKVLVLNSYHQGFSWTDQQTKAIMDTFIKSDVAISYSIEYLDWKQFESQNNLNLQIELYSYKYSQAVPELIVTTDDAALEFALNNRDRLFPNAPIVFCGVFENTATALIGDSENVIGVYEALDPKGTLEIAMRLNPKVKNLYILHDNSESGIGSADNIRDEVLREGLELNLVYLNNYSMEEIKELVAALSEDSIIIAGSYSSDALGYQQTPEQLIREISESSSVPIYDLYEFRLGSGVLGGSLLSGSLQGEEAAKLAIKLLEGQRADNLENIARKTVVAGFDYDQLTRYHISSKLLPKDSVIINKPTTFIKEHWDIVVLAAVVFGLMVLYISMLSLNINKRKRVEAELIGKNEEITQIYEELAASDEELFAQLEELITSQEQLTLSEQRYKLVVDSSNDVIWDWDIKTGQRLFTNKWYEVLGYSSEEIQTYEQWSHLIHPEDKEKVLQSINEHLAGKSAVYTEEYRISGINGEYRWIRAKGKSLFDKEGMPYRMIGTYTDITQLKSNEERIKHMAYYDIVTGLPNRAYLNEYVDKHLQEYRGSNKQLALIYIDTDNFKLINDTYGHSEGDRLLREIGRRLSSKKDFDSIVFRIGGDEFAVIIKNFTDKNQVAAYTQQLISSLDEPILISDNLIHTSISAGIVVYPEDGEDFEELLKNADAAMYEVKDTGKRTFVFFNKMMNTALIEKINMEKRLRQALDNHEFILHYQPEISSETGDILGFEALLRWHNPELGNVPPNKFIKIAEDTGLIIPIGEWVIKNACCFAASMQEKMGGNRFVSINLSTLQLRQENFISNFINIMKETKVKPSCINIEITETILMDSFEENIKKLNQLREHGVHISLDDFGTGYSSLTYLRRLPIDVLKIDKSFVDDILIDKGNKRIINSMIQLAHSLGLMVVAEGVEEQEQYEYLKKNSCDLIQGYYFSKPIPETEVYKLLDK